jgi:hypothetical protein
VTVATAHPTLAGHARPTYTVCGWLKTLQVHENSSESDLDLKKVCVFSWVGSWINLKITMDFSLNHCKFMEIALEIGMTLSQKNIR